ncbi:chloride transport protein 6-like [Oncorhynchus tshawytscha]|uniref:chloride transport protein 6-like n=1 Tax=Oncorhynchus tshawytscha TaxID=74940 RepID=UPI001C3CD5A4|nr:chloride transport protein 6-like [Oncorhynchus tshawytscha]
MEERFRPLTFHSIIFAVPVGQPAHPWCLLHREQSSATQPRLSYAEMTEDYPCFPDIHNLDLALLNPRMIVIVGIITRHNLTHEFLLVKLRQHYITISAPESSL